jgi:hypothetical protein
MRRPRAKRVALVLVALVVAAVAYGRARIAPQADVGAAWMAKHMCSCVFVGGRDAAACRGDLAPEMDPVRWELDADGVRAWVPLLAERRARFHEGSGCTLE